MIDVDKATAIFDVLWNLEEFEEAVSVYIAAERPFWLAQEVANYYESRGRIEDAINEWRHLTDTYFSMGERFLPLLQYPHEFFLLGSWYASTDRSRAIRYLTEYVRVSTKWGRVPGFNLPHRNRALRILHQLRKLRSCE